MRKLVLGLVLLILFLAPRANAAPAGAPTIPEPLKPWTAWALHGKEEALCPTLQGSDAGAPQCAWPARLALVLDEKHGTWKQAWHVDAKGSVPLPGDDKRWPLDVTVDGKRAVVVPQNGVPHVELEAGDHAVAGTFAWDSLPESIQVPPETALLELTLRGKRIDEPNRDAKGTVWLQKTVSAEEGERLDFVVHRKVVDEVPLILTTRITLNVAGRNREVLLGKMLPPGFVPMAIDSQLPARVEPDTRLRLQARPGTWTIEVVARSEGPVRELARPNPDGPWRDGEEVWVFEARNNLRLVDVQGVSAIDPQQTSLPDEWKKLPAYPLALGSKLQLVERRRGDAEPPPDHLTLQRTMWLDFDGKAFTVADTLGGNLHRASRLEMLPPTTLGRVAIDGKDQFITHLDDSKTGVEVRQGTLNVSADSRLVADPTDVPAVGWNHDFHSVSATLHLPPGFRLLHASGVDDVPGTWVKHWTLLELFLALVLAIGAWRLYGVKWGALALVSFALLFPESDAPKYVLIPVLLCEALVRALDHAVKKQEIPSRGLLGVRRIASLARAGMATLLVVISIPFLVSHVRVGLYPSLDSERELPSFADGDLSRNAALEQAPAASASSEDVEKAENKDERSGLRAKGDEGAMGNPNTRGSSSWGSSTIAYKQFNAKVYDPSSMVQTGPGRPRWSFTQVPLKWSGPVDRAQRLHLYLLTPTMNAALAIVRALLLIALVVRLVPLRPRKMKDDRGKTWLGFATAGLAFLMSFTWPSPAHAQAVPDREVLEELSRRILETPSCAPTCASSSRMLIEASKTSLRVRVEIEAGAPTAIPLPTSTQWSPEDVLLDGKPARALKRTDDGRVWIAVEKGWHQAVLVGGLPDRELVQLNLPLKPHHVEAQAEGWRVEGIHEDGLADDNLQLTRVRASQGGATLEPGQLPPFVRIERTLLIGLDWQVLTKVVRLSPLGTAIVLEVPLLKGESVTTADVRVAGGKAQLNLPPSAQEVSWKSVLDPKSPVLLSAPKSAAWTELWRLDMSPVWHADFEGVPVVHASGQTTLPEWRPWPGETVIVKVSRPDGVNGNTLTIDESHYALEPGLRATDATLELKMRSSRGAQHAIKLPEGSVLESVTVNDATQPIQQEGRKVTLPIAPGSQTVKLKWRMPLAMGVVFTAPEVDLGTSSVNANTVLTMPQGRWLLALRGPHLGPVVLAWSLLAIVLVVAGIIGLMKRTPLKIWQWMLLAVGLSQLSVIAAALVVGWLHLVAWRERKVDLDLHAFNIRQLVLVLSTGIVFILLLVAVHQGLLGSPDMQVRGNGSYASSLHWFTDRSDNVLAASVRVISVPMLAYRVAMLAWALWLALSVVRWLRWGWSAFGVGGYWRKPPPPPPVPLSPHRVPANPMYQGAPPFEGPPPPPQG